MPHGRNIYATLADMAMVTMCEYPPPQHKWTHCKCVLHFCSNFPHIYLSDQESDNHYSNAYLLISFHIYHLIAKCTVNG